MEVALYEQNDIRLPLPICTCAWKVVSEHEGDIKSCTYSFKPPPIVQIAVLRGLMELNQPMKMIDISSPVADP